MYITVDGSRVTNHSIIQWGGSTTPAQHSFSAVGATTIAAGNHTVSLMAAYSTGSYFVAAGSNLSIMTNPAAAVYYQERVSDSSTIDFTTSTLIPPPPPKTVSLGSYNNLPFATQLSQVVNSNGSPIIAIASGRSYISTPQVGFMGDAMWGILYDGTVTGWNTTLGSTNLQWSVNDLYTGAELQGPMFTQAYFGSNTVGNHTISLAATEFPWGTDGNPNNDCGKGDGEDCVAYKVGAYSGLVVLSGGMTLQGAVSPLCAGSCGETVHLPVGSDFILAEKTVTVPTGHSGTLMMMAKTRVQGQGPSSFGGIARLFLKVDGVPKGSVGLQELSSPSVTSQRTLSASYLATGANKLSVGSHTIRVIVRLDGSFGTMPSPPYVYKEIPLIYFD
jgi:hypothetical protein